MTFVELIAQKEALDRRNAEALYMAPYDRWVADALEAMLRDAVARPSERLAGWLGDGRQAQGTGGK